MNDYYIEQRVKQNIKGSTMLKIVGLIMSIFVVICIAFRFPILFMLAIPYVAFVCFLVKRSDYEYEYLFCQGELDFDRIMAKSARKRILTVNIKEMEVLAPAGSPELQRYQGLKVYDCSSNSGNDVYVMVAKRNNQLVQVVFEPNEKMLDGIRFLAPRKVFKK